MHRALVKALRLGEGGLEEREIGRLREVAQQISDAERRAMAAERETVDRLIAAHLADRIGATFTGRIAGVTRSGLFVRLKDTGADGFVPVSSLHNDFYNHIEGAARARRQAHGRDLPARRHGGSAAGRGHPLGGSPAFRDVE